MIAQSEKWVLYSSKVMPPLPTSSMSGSFQPPGPAASACRELAPTIQTTLSQLSPMSAVVRQSWPTPLAHFQGSFRPHSQMLRTIGRPLRRRASRNFAYSVGASRSSQLHQSTLM